MVDNMKRKPDQAALTDGTWAEMRLQKALKFEYGVRRDAGIERKIEIFGGQHDHLAALSLAEKKYAADPKRFEHLEVEDRRERWLRILRFCKKIAGPGRRKRATTKVFRLLRKEHGVRGGCTRWSLPPNGKHSRRHFAKRIITKAVETVPRRYPEYRRFISQSIRVTESKTVTIADVKTNCRRVARFRRVRGFR